MKKFGLIGHPLGHSLSPLIHQRIMELSGIDGTYTLFDIPPEEFDAAIPRLLKDLDGLNCTIPHKRALLPHLKSLDTCASVCGAVNTIFQERGYNTDTEGFLSAGIPLAGQDVLLLGAGGSAYMMAAACINAGARSLEIRARHASRSIELLDHLAQTFPGHHTLVRLDSEDAPPAPYSVILNATPLGMWPHCGEVPCDFALLRPGVSVFDAIYNPTPTRLLLNARHRGAQATGGLRMLLRQAMAAQHIWNPEVKFDDAAIERTVLPELIGELFRHFPIKILVTGFMGSGKSTIAQRLATHLGIGCVDLDLEIERFACSPIEKIFEKSGEKAFRMLETLVAESTLRHGGSAVVAAGGGLPASPENRKMIRSTNTLVVNLDAEFEPLWQRVDADTHNRRPLAASRDKAQALYETRRPIYQEFCDSNFNANQEPEALATEIAAVLTDIGRTT